jgi:hypothetical protein
MSGRAEGAPNPLREFVVKYYYDATGFVREVLGVEPDPKQVEALDAISRGDRRISIRSGHGVGKTTLLAWIILWWMLTRYPQKTVCTAPTSKQLFGALANETILWLRKLPLTLQELFEPKAEEIFLKADPTSSFVSFRTSRPEMPEALAGVHSENVLLVGDEASGIPEQVFIAASGSMSGLTACTILAGNPVRSSGLFYDTHNKLSAMWTTIHISCLNHPRIAQDFIEDMKARYGEDSNDYRVRVLGEFPLSEADTVIPYDLMALSLTRDVRPLLVKPVWGLDCAGHGSDKSALCKRQGNVITEPVTSWKGLDTMELVGRVHLAYKATPVLTQPNEIAVDAIGLGAGVADRLREMGLPARGINVSETAALTDKYRNLRAELAFTAREWFERRDVNIGNDSFLGAELVNIRWKPTSSGKIQIESKDDMRRRGVKSPNLADAFFLTFAADATAALYGSKMSKSWKEPLTREIKGLV